MKIERTGTAGTKRHVKMLLCGDPGKGKTLFGSTAPYPLYLAAEGGLMSIDERRIPTMAIDSRAEFLSTIQILQKPGPDRIRTLQRLGYDSEHLDTLVVDTIDEIGQIFAKEFCVEKKLDTLSRDGYGWLKEQMKSVVTALRNLDMHVILTCHLKSRTDDTTGKVSLLPAMEGSFDAKLAQYVDLALLLDSTMVTQVVNNKSVQVVRRWIQTYADPQHDWIKDHSGKLPLEFPLNFDDDFMRMADLIWPTLGPSLNSAPGQIKPKYNRSQLGQVADPVAPVEGERPQEEALAPQEAGIPATAAKQKVFEAADGNPGRALEAWRGAGLEFLTVVTEVQLADAVSRASLASAPS